MTTTGINLFSFQGKTKILHLSWFAFFLTFMIWFNHAPLMATLRETFGLTPQEVKTLLILNVALTIPARIIIGMLVDRYGPRIVYSILLAISGLLCLLYAMANSFEQLAITRFLMGFVGAGFVIGIRMVSEWFPAREVGIAEGIYGGWGNFGSAAAAMTLPSLALLFGGEDGWRYAIGLTGITALIYSFIYYLNVSNTPKGSTYFKPKRSGALEVSSKGDLLLYLIMNLPMVAALAVLNWKLSPNQLGLYGEGVTLLIYGVLFSIYLIQTFKILQINRHLFKGDVAAIDRYPFKQVAVLELSYMITFGSELAVVSMLPLFFLDTFEITPVLAGMLASGFAFMNLVARPGGGYLSDRFGRKKTLSILISGLSVGYFVLSHIDAQWALPVALLATMSCSFFVQAGEGAVFAMVPLVKRRLTGQVAGMTGAYGNVGAVIFLTVLSFVEPQVFFLTIAAAALLVLLVVVLFLDEPEGHMAEVLPDGTVELIEVT
ncbi:MAG: NarK family nitrate/nitrite MFS transporter [Gammaproteobacteria bacterium]|jgi:MFS transporter, NNP family, nitrate/nitrite transporter|nr:NarK family nitrate/nitrite MFS transporter [Gammaproteobacteria bacterium]MBT7306780.1 NarK family nitrate/nitrite MFS transporter [Gammaproteobacteria bacterium]